MNKNIDYIKIEELENNLVYLKYHYKLNYFYDNWSPHHIKKNDNESPFLGKQKWNIIYNLIEKNGSPHYKYFYNKKIKNLVETLYELDLDTFGYTWNDFILT